MTEVASAQPAVTIVAPKSTETVTIQAPTGCSATVLLNRVGESGGRSLLAIWILAGRYLEGAVTLSCELTADDLMFRIDVPQTARLSIEYLQECLDLWWAARKKQGIEPDDTPIIVGLGGPRDPT